MAREFKKSEGRNGKQTAKRSSRNESRYERDKLVKNMHKIVLDNTEE